MLKLECLAIATNFFAVMLVVFAFFLPQTSLAQLENQTINFEPPLDTTPPVFSNPVDMVVEATTGQGAMVFYQMPTVSDNTEVIGSTCIPVSSSTFSLGTSLVSCTAVDAEGNIGQTTFTITVQDTTAPSIIPPPDITLHDIADAFSLGMPTISDAVDSFPTVSNDATSFLAGENIVTWTVIDFSGNSASVKQIVNVLNPILLTKNVIFDEFVFEAEGPQGATVDFSTIDSIVISNAEVTCQPQSNSLFPIGDTEVSCSAGNNTTTQFTISVRDTTPPTLSASFVPVKVEEDEGIFTISVSATDLVDQNPTIFSTINNIPVQNGQLVKLELDSKSESKYKVELLKIEDTSFVLTATAIDAFNNTATITATPQFFAEPEELLELELEELEEETELEKEKLESEIESLKEKLELFKEEIESEIELLEEQIEDESDPQTQAQLKEQIENKKTQVEELKEQLDVNIKAVKQEIKDLEEQKKDEAEAKKKELEDLKKQKEKDELLASIQEELKAKKHKDLEILIASAANIVQNDHISKKLFDKILDQKTIEQLQSEVSDRKGLDDLGSLGDISTQEMKELAKEEEKLRELELKELEKLIKNVEKLGDFSLKEIEDLTKEQLRKKEQELKEIEKIASSVSDEAEKKRIENEIKQKKKEIEDFKKKKEAEFETHKKEAEVHKKELEKKLEIQKKEAEIEKKAIEKAIEKQKELEEKAKEAQKQVEEKQKEIEKKAKEAEKKAQEQQKAESSSDKNDDKDDDDDKKDNDDDDDDD